MRKTAAILLCGIFFFNWAGYRFLTNLLEDNAIHRLDARLDRQQYDVEQLVTIKVPVTSLAYYNNSAGFERSSGQIEIGGIPYRYVESRIYNDTLEMRCIPNESALSLRQSDLNHLGGVNQSFQSDPYIGIRPVHVQAPACEAGPRAGTYRAGLFSLTLPGDERPPAPAA